MIRQRGSASKVSTLHAVLLNPIASHHQSPLFFLYQMKLTKPPILPAALDFRTNICGGEPATQAYSHKVAQESATAVAAILGTDIMDAPGSCIRDCAFANVRLPLEQGLGESQVDPAHAHVVSDWFKETGSRESGMYFQTVLYGGVWYWRVSGMVYVEVEDFRRGAEVLRGLCERVRRGEHVKG